MDKDYLCTVRTLSYLMLRSACKKLKGTEMHGFAPPMRFHIKKRVAVKHPCMCWTKAASYPICDGDACAYHGDAGLLRILG